MLLGSIECGCVNKKNNYLLIALFLFGCGRIRWYVLTPMKFKKISISMDVELYGRLKMAAEAQKRTFSNFISHIAESMLPHYEKAQIKPMAKK